VRFALPQNSNVELLITTSRGGYPITTLVPERYYEAKRKGLSSSASKRGLTPFAQSVGRGGFYYVWCWSCGGKEGEVLVSPGVCRFRRD
jgi:hypothetical protein